MNETDLTQVRYNRIASFCDLMEILPERRYAPWRQELWAQVPAGHILEVGVGTSKNIPYYPPAAEITAIDLAPGMLARAQRRSEALGRTLDLRQGDVQHLDFPDNTFVAAVATFVFCSVPDPLLGLRELGRVVRPGGQILLLEHVHAPNPALGRLMDLLNPVVVRLLGANINRRTVENVQRAGPHIQQVRDIGLRGIFKIIRAQPDH